MEDDIADAEIVESYSAEVTAGDGARRFNNINTREDLMQMVAACVGGFLMSDKTDFMIIDLRKV